MNEPTFSEAWVNVGPHIVYVNVIVAEDGSVSLRANLLKPAGGCAFSVSGVISKNELEAVA